jgi:hypothetical protein
MSTPHCVRHYQYELIGPYCHRGKPRQFKKFLRPMFDKVNEAFGRGTAEAYRRNPRPNPYPPGRRHDAWDYGLRTSDPLGEWHGRNE